MKGRYLPLSVKLNILIVVIVLAVLSAMVGISDNTYWRTVYDPYVRKLDGAWFPEDEIARLLPGTMEYFGTEELTEVRERISDGDGLAFHLWTSEKPSSLENTGTERTMNDDMFDLQMYLDIVGNNLELDEICLEAKKGEAVYSVVQDYREDDFATIFDKFGSEGIRFPGHKPEDFASPALLEDGQGTRLVRCIRIGTESGEGFAWLVYDMSDFILNHRVFLVRSILLALIATVLTSAVMIFALRRLVTRRVRSLAQAAREFVPGGDGRFSMDRVSRAETETADEIGDLGRDIRSMQEKIVRNTETLEQMTAEKERINTELDLAARIQEAVLPDVLSAFPERTEFELCASMTPARAVGGDFYDFFLTDEDHLALVIADVSGKGIPASLFMMVAKSLIRNQLMGGCDPAQAMERVNRQLCDGNTSMMFVTVWAAVVELSTGRGTVCNAGHEKPGIRRAGGGFELVKYKHDSLAGALPEAKYHVREFELSPGDCVFVYTDGVTEATDSGGAMFGEKRLAETLNGDPGAAPEELVRRVREAVDRFAGGAPQFDDITMLCLRYKGPQGRKE